MKRILAFSILMVFLFSVAAVATETRVTTMGEVNEVVKDNANIWLYPQTIAMYPNMFIGEFDGDDFGRLGGNWAFGDYTFGAYFEDNSGYEMDGIGWAGDFDDDFDDWYHHRGGRDIDHRIDLFWGMNFSDMPWGLRVSGWKEGESFAGDEASDYDMHNTYRRFEFSLGTTFMDGKLDAAFAMGFNSWTEEATFEDSAEDLNTFEASESDGSTDFDLRLRYWYETDEQWTLIPHGSFSNSKHAVINNEWFDDGTDIEMYPEFSFEDKSTVIVLGMGSNFQVNEDVMTVTDFGFEFWTNDYTETEVFDFNDPDFEYTETSIFEGKTNMIPYFKIGLDADVLKWLDLRCGAFTRWGSETDTGTFETVYVDPDVDDESYGGEYKEQGSETNLYLGVGLHWGDLELDTELNTEFMGNGPYFVSGENDELFHRVSLKYNF